MTRLAQGPSSKCARNAVSQGCLDIAHQLVDFRHGDDIDVMPGGGRQQFHIMASVLASKDTPDQRGERS